MRAPDAKTATASPELTGRPTRTGRANRVQPDGRLIATPARGLYWGNRGSLLGSDGEPARHHRGRGWVICVLDFHGRRRTQWRPGRLTELYFLDEATALAAGHRPCGECRHADYRRFVAAWRSAHPTDPVGVRPLDARLHRDRLDPARRGDPVAHRRHRHELAELPVGTVIDLDGRFWLVGDDALHGWTPAGYQDRRERTRGPVEVLTPRSTVAALAAGYRPVLHPSIDQEGAR